VVRDIKVKRAQNAQKPDATAVATGFWGYKPACIAYSDSTAACPIYRAALFSGFGFDNLTATVKTVRADVVAQMHFTGSWL
jgi:hypothetical protein